MVNSTSNTETEKLRERIWSWLSNAGYIVESATARRALWIIVARLKSGVLVSIRQKAGQTDSILIQGALEIGDNEKACLGLMEAHERHELLHDLVLKLLDLGVQFQGVQDPLTLIQFEHPIYIDALTQDAFMQRMWQVFRALFIVQATLDRKLDKPPIKASSYIN